MSADNGIYILGPVSDGTFRVAYAGGINNMSYPSIHDSEAIEWTKETFDKDCQVFESEASVTSWIRPVKCKNRADARLAACRLQDLFFDRNDWAILEYGITTLGPYPHI